MCLEQQQSTERQEDQCLQSCCADHSPLWGCVLGHLSSPPPSHRALPSALPTSHPKHPFEWFRHQHRGPWNGYVYQHWSHAPQNTASLGRTCLRDRRQSPVKDHDIWRTSHWPSCQRDTSEKIPRHFEKVHRHLQGRSPSVDNTINKSHELATHLFLWNQTKGHHGRQKEKAENRDPSDTTAEQTVTCSRCGKNCLSRICFISHQRACTRRGLPHWWIFVRAKQSYDDYWAIKSTTKLCA